ncbi:hypothetical protein M422DRAFT_256218 [Sphaerobolus stellatus SS14]|uniref:Uncharacterized protein n=1 Tax=Sphaerobolus stellatus (strain SS14) TaxID=990650 RepID=A0A0C9VR53_SPHS4|nr:hypothetical protein M422DRAFT_256218 [Sphaerobolus stellatus SS14]
MSLPSLKLLVQHLFTPQVYLTNPHKLIFEDDEWETWLASESAVYTNWRFKKQSPEPKGEGKRKYEWKRIYECDHTGSP